MPRPRNRNLQFVWPKDGERGKNGPGGFWGRLGDILTDKGPDVFLQKKGSKTPIKPDRWGNWYMSLRYSVLNAKSDRDSYHHPAAARDEDAGFVSRGIRRYDPHSRRYKEWCIPIDWFGSYNQRVPGQRYSEPRYPRFTLKELRKMEHDTVRGRYPDPFAMGSDWNNMGPEVRDHPLRFHCPVFADKDIEVSKQK